MKTPFNEVQRVADAMLAEASEVERDLEAQRQVAQAAAEKVLFVFKAREAALLTRLEQLDKGIREYGKRNQAALFGGLDKVNLIHGSLLIQQTNKVVRKKAVTPDVLEGNGFGGAVKVVKSVNWDEIEKFTLEQLALIGTQRKSRATIEYELKEDKGKKAKE